MNASEMADVIELQQTLARYAAAMTMDDVDAVVDAFAADGSYHAFGDAYALADFPRLVAAAPKGAFLVGPPVLDLDHEAGTGRGVQPLCMILQADHSHRIGWYDDTYVRTDAGWRIKTRSMTFLRRSGARDSGRSHDPARPSPG